MFWITYIYFNFLPTPKQDMRLWYLSSCLKEKKKRNFVSCRYVFVKQASIVDEEEEPKDELPEVLRRKK